MLRPIGLLLVAIAIEVAATSLLPRTNGFRHAGWSLAVIAGYAASIGLLAIVVRDIPVSLAYALWSGLGTATVAVIGVAVLGEPLTPLKGAAIGMIVVGVVMLNLGGVH
jgi:small multidrug resistance pump